MQKQMLKIALMATTLGTCGYLLGKLVLTLAGGFDPAATDDRLVVQACTYGGIALGSLLGYALASIRKA